jgi:hypothetical protein
MNYPYRYATNSLKLNDRGKAFVDAEFVLGVEPRRDGQVATPWFELDMAGADKGHPEGKGIDGRVSIWGARGSRSSAIFDVEGDATRHRDQRVWRRAHGAPERPSEKRRVLPAGGAAGHALESQRLGAVVTVTAGGTTHAGAAASRLPVANLMPLYFGLGTPSVWTASRWWPWDDGRRRSGGVDGTLAQEP